MSARILIPATPGALLRIAASLDRLWAHADARGDRRLTLEEECQRHEAQSDPV